jgi:hypothetical protein
MQSKPARDAFVLLDVRSVGSVDRADVDNAPGHIWESLAHRLHDYTAVKKIRDEL